MSKTYQAEAGKGSKPRVKTVDGTTFSNNWDNIFKQKDNKPKLERCKVCYGEGGCFDAGHWYECPVCS